jgi:hypothetical protein
MLDNISQWLFFSGAKGYVIVVPVLRLIATLFMAISMYKLLKAREDDHKIIWMLAVVFFSPVLTRIAYEIYRGWIAKKDIGKVKGSKLCLIISVLAFILSIVITLISLVSMGLGVLKSGIDGEAILSFYDLHGNEYNSIYDVLLYDNRGNTYTYQSSWFTGGSYTDQNGKSYEIYRCYLTEDGYFYFDEEGELKPHKGSSDYYTDGDELYYYLIDRVYWESDGTMYGVEGKIHMKLFELEG